MATTFHHFGVPTRTKYEGAMYIEGAKVHVTDPAKHPYKIEFVRFEKGSPLPKEVQKNPHAAFMVDDLQAAVQGQKVLVAPCDVSAELKIAFISDGGAVIELMQMKK
jgi:glyoxylase I family protein